MKWLADLKKRLQFEFPETRDILAVLLLGIALPNMIMVLASGYTSADRPLINIDYFLAVGLIALGLRYIGLALLLALFLMDTLLFALQFFPFIRLNDLLYLSNFVMVGQPLYRLIFMAVLLVIAVKSFLILRYGHTLKAKPVLWTVVVCLMLNAVYGLVNLPAAPAGSRGLMESQTGFFVAHRNNRFLNLGADSGKVLIPVTWQSATQPWFTALNKGEALPDRMLLIVAESWGRPLSLRVHEQVLSGLKNRPGRYAFFEQGSLTFSGATVAGELRELCRLEPRTFYLRDVKTGFEVCLPARLKKRGYVTHAMHAAGGNLYDRTTWYKSAGFDTWLFGDQRTWPRECHSVPGACDLDMLDEVRKAFRQGGKTFFYWITLNTHAAYDARDVRHDVLDCRRFGLQEDTEGCRNLKLHASFFYGLGPLLDSPEMRGVEVVIVGDHPPPLLDLAANMSTFHPAEVSWVRFRMP